MLRDAQIAQYAARQHALVTLEQARACGFSVDAVRRYLKTGRWRRARRSVFIVAAAPSTWEQSVLAAVLAAGPDAVASHTAAGALWKLPNVFREMLEVSTARTLVDGSMSVAQLGIATDYARRELHMRLA